MPIYRILDAGGKLVNTVVSTQEWIDKHITYWELVPEDTTPVERVGRTGMKFNWCITKKAFYRRLTAAERATAPFKKLMEEYFLDDFIYLKENALETDVLSACGGDQMRADEILGTKPKAKELYFEV